MSLKGRRKLILPGTAALVSLALAVSSARADHDVDLVTPLVTIIAAGALLNYGHASHHYHHYYYYRRHGHYSYGHSRYRSGHYSHGYRKHGQHYRSHSSHGQYASKHRASKSRGGYHAPRHKH